MPVNEFEKQVQQKMNELQLRPSDEVWEEVEKRIRREKKRRRFIIWFFVFGALLLGGTAWWIAGGNKKQTQVNNSVAQTTAADKKTNELTTGIKSDTKSATIPEKKIDDSYENKTEKTEVQPTNDPSITKTEIVPDKKASRPVLIENSYKGETIINNSVTETGKKKKTNKTKPGSPVIAKNDQPTVIEKTDSVDDTNITGSIAKAGINTMIKDSVTDDKNIVQNDPAANRQETIPESKDSLVAEQTEENYKKDRSKVKKNKWEFGITAMTGISGKSDGISIFDGQKSFTLNNLSTSPGPASPQVVTVIEPANGFLWQTGAYAKRKLAARTGASVGLNFSSYSSGQRTGAFVDSSRVFSNRSYSSSVSNFFRNGSGQSYKNHYYYLELPFSFHWQINKGIKMPLILQNGFSAGFLTSSNALVYNSASNIFYHDNKLLYKAQFAYQSGLYVKLFNQSKNPLTAGVLFNYHFSKLEKVNSNGGNHLSSFGIQLGWLLKK